MTETVLLASALLLTLACAVFVAAEFSLTTVERGDLERAAEAGERGAEGALKAVRRLTFQLSGAQLGITVTSLVIGMLAEPSLAALLKGPLKDAGLGAAAAPDEVESVFTDDQLARMVVDASEAGLLSPADGERLRDALELGTRPVGEILVPVPRMRTVDTSVTPARLERIAAEAGYSRFPVTGPDSTLLGYLHIKDTLGVTDRERPFPRATLHPVTRVRIDTPLDDTLTALRADGSHLAAVTGRTGTVLGFVTMEDVLTELVGPTPATA
ncbi:CNNM domain-containing protein [Streptomyces sp. NPDC102270]|uniref:CNNM domain-containing protein n=1 Tax=Streptomyces sp. NPDC102270 TaxID=3366150 RepID=UPI00381ECA66